MMLTGVRALKAEERARREPLLPLVSFDLAALGTQINEKLFPNLTAPVPYWFVATCDLAFVTPNNPAIFIHPLLNRPDVPRPVFEHIFIHELIHLQVPGRKIDGKFVQHPPEFWEIEHRVSKDSGVVWAWLFQNFWQVLKVDRKRESTRVNRAWKKNFWQRELFSWEYVLQNPNSQSTGRSDESDGLFEAGPSVHRG